MKFLTDFLQRLKWSRRRLGDVKETEEPGQAGNLKSSEAPEDLPEKPRRWKKFKVVGSVCTAIGVVVVGLVLWWFSSSEPAVAPQTQATGALPLSAAEKELFQAIRSDDTDAVRRCLSSGASVNATDISGVTPIKVAVALNRTDAVRALLDAGYDDSQEGSSALIYAIVQNRPDITHELLKSMIEKGTAGKIVNKIDKNGYTPLMYAIDRSHVAIAQELLDAGADVNAPGKEGYTPLMMAAAVSKADMVAMLLKAGANANAVSPGKETAMSIARKRNKQVVVSLLLEAARETPPPQLKEEAFYREEVFYREEML
jgi:ankyrin repeat protein